MDMPHKCCYDDELSAGTIYRKLAAPLKSRAGLGGLENGSVQPRPVEGTCCRKNVVEGSNRHFGVG